MDLGALCEEDQKKGNMTRTSFYTHFLRIEMKVLSFDPSFWGSSASGALAGGVAAACEPPKAHIVSGPGLP